MQADEAKVKALESIFGGQDITASVIRTVLTTNENKFDDAVDSLLNLTTTTQPSPPPAQAQAPPPVKKEEEREDPLFDRREREKIKTLEGMFGNDLSNSVICTVLQSNKGELVDTVDTLLNMTSVELDPSFGGKKPSREDERLRQEQELRDYEEYKRLQIKLQEEEARVMKEQQQKREEELLRKAEDEQRSKEVLLEQERILREYEEQNKKRLQGEQAAKAEAIRKEQEAALLKRAQEEAAVAQVRKEQEAAAAALKKAQQEAEARAAAAAEASARKAAEDAREAAKAAEALRKLKLEEAALREAAEAAKTAEAAVALKKLQLQEAALREAALKQAELKKREEEAALKLAAEEAKQKAVWEEKLAKLKAEEEKLKMAEASRLRELETKERQLAQRAAELKALKDEADRKHEAKIRQAQEELRQKELAALRIEEELNKKKFEEEERAHRRRMEDEEKELALRRRLEEEKAAIAAERDALAAHQRELLKRQDEQYKAAATQRAEAEALAAELKMKEAEALRADEQRKAELEVLAQRVKEAEERERLRREEAEARRIEEERKVLEQERLEREAAAAIEEEKKKVYEQMAASAVFIPPKVQPATIVIGADVSGDSITATWDIPEGSAAPSNWLGLYPVRQNNVKKYVQFEYTKGASSGEHVFRGVTPGKYNVRFFATRSYENEVVSEAVHVGPMATIMPQVQGEHVLVYYTLSPLSSTPTREWIGIYEQSQRRNKLYISTAYGNAEGQVMMKAPRTPGVYEVRLFATGAVYNESTKAEFVIEDNDCVNVEPASVMAGANVTINWILRTLEPSTGDWVGLYRADEANNSQYLSCTYTNGASVGTATVAAPKEVGVYEFRLFSKAKGKYTTHRTSLPLTVV